ncbi:MAG: hypothetical protein GVX78_00340 [Bacteroidetes bacterium]|jgi:tetratricopeptide (TPR) repeat protein|nr:hypothetical protein [Bacteroidota bacterium]
MINLYTTDKYKENLVEIISSEHRLIELVQIKDLFEELPRPSALSLIIDGDGIKQPLDWNKEMPPYLLPKTMMVDDHILLGLVYMKLGNFEKAYQFLESHTSLLAEIDFIRKLQLGLEADPNQLAVETYQPYDDYRLMHNNAIVRLYATQEGQHQSPKIDYYFREAIENSPNEEYMAWTTDQYISFLLDQGKWEEARQLLSRLEKEQFSKAGKIELAYQQCQLDMRTLSPPYDQDKLSRLKDNLWSCLSYYEGEEQHVLQGLCLLDAAEIANLTGSFAESLGYYTKAISIFSEANLPEFVYETHLKKGKLLLSWGQKGSPQFYKPAMEDFQRALKLYSKEDFPYVYAEIQENLGIIYSHIPDETKKKGIWAAISSSAFKEALNLFEPNEFPYEYARVCNHYANALLRYPEAILSDNQEKALFYYDEALKIRNAETYPLERSLTLLNYLEACWFIQQEEKEFKSKERLQDMYEKAEEVIRIQASDELVTQAKNHKNDLKNLDLILDS